jgi:hypothetical protein
MVQHTKNFKIFNWHFFALYLPDLYTSFQIHNSQEETIQSSYYFSTVRNQFGGVKNERKYDFGLYHF